MDTRIGLLREIFMISYVIDEHYARCNIYTL
jgi:hypothetical protein